MGIYQVIVIGVKGVKLIIDISDSEEHFKRMTVQLLREKLAEKFPAMDDMRLISATKQLDKDCNLLSEYGIEHKSVILLIPRLPGGLTA